MTPLPLPAFPRSTLVIAQDKHKGHVYLIPILSSTLAVPTHVPILKLYSALRQSL